MKKNLRTKKIPEMVLEIKLVEHGLPFERINLEIKKSLKQIFLVMMPIFALTALGILCGSALIINLGFYISIGATATYSFIKGLKPIDLKEHFYKDDEVELLDQDCEDRFDTFHHGMSKYYTEEMKEQIKQGKKFTKEDKKYYLALMKQRLNEENKPRLVAINGETIVNKNDLPFDKEESLNQISLEMDAYLKTYTIPEYLISSEEWQILFDELYNYFEYIDMKDSFYDYASKYNRMVLAIAIVEKSESLTIDDYINNLDLFSELLDEHTYKARDIRYLKKYIREYIKNIETNIVFLNDAKIRKLK